MQNPYGASTIQCFPLDDRVQSSHWHPTGGATSTMTTNNDDKRTIIEGIAHRYVVVAHLGAGGMGSTQKVFDFKSGPMKKFAIKIMQPELACRDARAKQHFVHEARATMALGHPNVVTVHYLDELLDGTPLYAMELLNGKSVAQLIKDMGRIHPVVALNLIVDMLDGLREAHKHVLIHQDAEQHHDPYGEEAWAHGKGRRLRRLPNVGRLRRWVCGHVRVRRSGAGAR